MERELKSNYARINDTKSILEVYETEPSTNWQEFALKNVVIKFRKDTTIEVTGEKIEWAFSFDREFVEDLKHIPDEKYTKLGYKTIFDFFKGIKKPYVEGMYKLKKTTPYHCIMAKWYIVL